MLRFLNLNDIIKPSYNFMKIGWKFFYGSILYLHKICPFVLFLLTIVLSVLRFTDSDYHFGIFKLFLNIFVYFWKIFRLLFYIVNHYCIFLKYLFFSTEIFLVISCMNLKLKPLKLYRHYCR